MPPFLVAWGLKLMAKPWFAKLVGILAAIGAFLVFLWRVYGAGKKAQQMADLKANSKIVEKQREEANRPPVGQPAIRERMRDGKL